MLDDTIAAVSTPPGQGGIAVIRMSGPDAVAVADRLFRSRRKLAEVPSHTVHYGRIVDPDSGETVEEVLVTVMRAPRSYTREDVVEIGCHGGFVAVKKVLELLFRHGARPAEPGEFTKRAFLNGRIDLSQAEAVMDLIRAKSDRAFRIARRQAEGVFSREVRRIRDGLLSLLAHMAVHIDYPEHDEPEITSAHIVKRCDEAIDAIDQLLRAANRGKVYREGLTAAIVGRPNVGKSSLLNALARENKAIVTDIPGTTRDLVEEYVTLADIPFRLLDTAGLRETEDVVEKIGIEKTRQALEEADLVLLVLDASRPLEEEDRSLAESVSVRASIAVVNKTDLPPAWDVLELTRWFPEERIVSVSAREGIGLDLLEQTAARCVLGGEVEPSEPVYVGNARHVALLEQAKRSLEEARKAAQNLVPVDFVQIDVQTAWEKLGEILGEQIGEALIDRIFSEFCLGK